MIDRIRKPGGRSALWTLIAVALAAVLIPGSMAEAKIKPKDGLYYDATSNKDPAYGYVSTKGGKIGAAGFSLRFKNKKGKGCVPNKFSADSAGNINLAFGTSKAKPNRKGKFSVKVKKSPFFPGLKGTVSGKFKSAKKAMIKAKLKADGCTAKAKFKKAVYTTGG
ncbi:MAG: hypothetical protein IPK93_03380 [Solirubrobacterales bacterium]|nr:hypothetical protein [Solirubrobacterales bacterium]